MRDVYMQVGSEDVLLAADGSSTSALAETTQK